MSKEVVVVLGISDNPDRYSYKAYELLKQYGHRPIGVSPKLVQFHGEKCHRNLGEVLETVDTLTVYVNPQISSTMINEIIKLGPKRVIFNPGSENPGIVEALKKDSIDVLEACTLVLLKTHQF